MDNNKKNKDIISIGSLNISRLSIVIIMLLIVVIGGTFAWFTYRSSETALVLSIGDINDSKVIINPYQIRENMVPTNTYLDGVYSQVSVINNNTGNMKLKLYYKINELDEVLINNGLKYTIVSSSSKDGTYTEVITGNFEGAIDGSNLSILEVDIVPSTIYYRVYLWLDNEDNQSDVQNSSLNVELNAIGEFVKPYQEELLNGADPVLDDGMIPITLSSTGVATVADTSSEWYNYEEKEWANAVLVKKDATADVDGSQSREYYLNNPGAEILESDILAYYVWIPRYKYQIWTVDATQTTSPQTINIVFEDSSTTKSNGTSVGGYLTHPAFTFGTQELNGIWVGKFETSGTASAPKIKPNVKSLRSQNVSTQFTTSLVFAGGTLTDGVVSFVGSDTYGLTTKSDSHMMKNSEWGAVAYLSHSQHGINSEIYINNSSGYYTGRSGGNVGGSQNKLATQFPDSQTSSTRYNSYGYYTWTGQAIGVDGTIGEITDSTLGTKASTTGNITGVYDMSGGAREYVMGNYAQTTGSSGFSTFPENKYYDLYSSEIFTGDSNTNMGLCTLESCGGDALFETAKWYGDYAYFASSDDPWFLRGGNYSNGAKAGVFDSNSINGNAFTTYSWRSSLLVAD